MLRLIPAPAHRVAYRVADRVRKVWWRVRKPHLQGVSVVAHDERGQILLIRLSYGKGYWSFPGGGIKKGETPAEAATREMTEEVGCHPYNLRPIGVLEEDLSGARSTVHVFSAACMDTPRPDRREVIETRFSPLHSLPEPMSDMARRRLDLWRSYRRAGEG